MVRYMKNKTKPSDVIRVNAKLKVKVEELKKRLNAFPFAKAVEGTEIKYRICRPGKEKTELMILECTKEEINLGFYFDEKSKPGKTLNLLRFMSLLAYLKDCYEVTLGELYEPLVESISYAAVIKYKPYIEMEQNNELLDSLGVHNLALANKINEMEGSMHKLEDELFVYKDFTRQVLERFTMKGDMHGDFLGIDEGLRSKIVTMLDKKSD